MTEQAVSTEEAPAAKSNWARLPISARAILSGLAVALVGVNLWAAMLISIGPGWALIPPALLMLVLFVYWTSGRAWPDKTSVARAVVFRPIAMQPSQWIWSIGAALFFVVIVEAGLVVLFRIIPFPVETFRAPYRETVGPLLGGSPILVWAIILCGALTAGVCEETGFRGYMQLPIERRHGPLIAILVSSALFTVFHLNQAWAIPPMLPIIFIAGALLGLLAWSSNSLIPGMIGHALMDVCNFAYWWTGYAGDFKARPIGEVGMDSGFFIALALLIVSLLGFFVMLIRLRLTPRAA